MSARQSSTRFPRLILLLGSLLAVACDDVVPSVVTGRAYDPAAMCLDAYSPIGVVEAITLSSRCDPVCLAVGTVLYVTTVCGPYPVEATKIDPMAPECVKALSLLKADKSCK